MVTILNLQLIFFSTVPYLLMKEALSSALYRRATMEGEGRPPLPFYEKQKKCLNLRKKGPDYALLWVKFSIENVVWGVSKRKNTKMFPCGAFLSWLLTKCLLKCPNSKKPPLPGKVSNCAPALSSLDWNLLDNTDYTLTQTLLFGKTSFKSNKNLKVLIATVDYQLGTSLLNYVPYVPSCFTRLRTFRALRAFVPSHLTYLRALRALTFTRLNYALCRPYLLFARLAHSRYKISY